MPLSWNEIKSRALTFSRTWADAANEDSQGKPFWIDFFEIFGITNKRVATFEHAVKKIPAKAHGEKSKTDGFVDLFWPGMLLVEQKSRGKNLDAALTQALSYFPGIAERDLPQIIIVCVGARAGGKYAGPQPARGAARVCLHALHAQRVRAGAYAGGSTVYAAGHAGQPELRAAPQGHH